ncbi:MAG: leucine-rich repeat domain-containing protein [Holosporales bacterium]|nr:leucine-rich repeat domain-containing protein [Holosporales bacterium]
MERRKIWNVMSAFALGILYHFSAVGMVWLSGEELHSEFAFPRGMIVQDGMLRVCRELVTAANPQEEEGLLIQSIVIPANIERIGRGCFVYYLTLFTVAFEANSQFQTIAPEAFRGSGVQSIALPRSVEELSYDCFAGCLSLACVTFEPGFQPLVIGENVFMGSGLQFITVPACVEALSKCCFARCRSLAVVTFGTESQLRTVGGRAFLDTMLDCVYLPRAATLEKLAFDHSSVRAVYFGDEPASIFSGMCAGTNYPQELVVPGNIEVIEAYCFANCACLTDVSFAAGSQLREIRKKAFTWSGLRSLALPRSVEVLEKACFAHCQSLATLTFDADSRLRIVGDKAFFHTKLNCVRFPSAVDLGGCVLGRSSVRAVYFGGELAGIFSGICAGTGINLGQVVIPPDLETLKAYCFAGCLSLTTVTFEEGSQIRVIEEGAFSESGLLSIRIAASVEVLGRKCFAHCQSLATLTFEEGSQLRAVGDWALLDTMLDCVRFPSAVDLGECVLGRSSVRAVYFGDEPASIFSGMCAGTGINLGQVVIPPDLETLKAYCFADCASLTNVTFEAASHLRVIGEEAFVESSLRAIYIPASVEKLGSGSFYGCALLTTVTFEGNSRLQVIEEEAFAKSSLQAICIPMSVGTLGRRSFRDCLFLVTVTFEIDSHLRVIEEEAFAGSSLETICLPASVETLGRESFRDCLSLSALVFEGEPAKVEAWEDIFYRSPLEIWLFR